MMESHSPSPGPTLLAAVVPAFKGQFLLKALNCLADQTDQGFRIYVFDDASPDDLHGIYHQSRLRDRPNASFHRFEENLGGKSLSKQWDRCVTHTAGEPWVWLFSDDDLADRACTAAFLDALRAEQASGDAANVYRFNTVLIDEQDEILSISPPHPTRERSVRFIYHKLVSQRNSYAPEHLFSRAAYDRAGGFVDFPFALGSDDASWVSFAEDKPIRTVEGAHVYWRWGQSNTSRLSGPQAVDKLMALCDYAVWLQRRFARETVFESELASLPGLDRVAEKWLLVHISYVKRVLSPSETRRLASHVHEKMGLPLRAVRVKVWRAALRLLIWGNFGRVKALLGR